MNPREFTSAPDTRRIVRVVRASAIYDVVVTAAFALPFTAPLAFAGVAGVTSLWRLHGTVPDPGDEFALMFANLMGSLVVVWAVFRLLAPTALAGYADVAARVFFSVGMVAALMRGAMHVVVGLLALEITWAVVQLAVLLRARRRPAVAGAATPAATR